MRNTDLIWAFAIVAALSFSSPVTAEETTPTPSLETVNLNFILASQRNYQEVISTARTPYSKELSATEKKFNDFNASRNTIYSSIVYLDPSKFDAGSALGLAPETTMQTMLMQRGIRPFPALTAPALHFMNAAVSTNNDNINYTQEPHALTLLSADDVKYPCLIIPAPDNALPASLKIRGMSAQANRQFLNDHEGWHCLDQKYYRQAYSSPAYHGFDPLDLSTLLQSKEYLAAYAILHKSEVFADVAAASHIIREGADPSLIEQIAAWRRQSGSDLLHMSVPALNALHLEINRIGIENFRQMSVSDLTDLCYRLVEEHALDAESLEIKIKYDLAQKRGRDSLARRYSDNPALARVREFQDFAIADKNRAVSAAIVSMVVSLNMSPQDAARRNFINESLNQWDASKELKRKAMEMYGIITPANLAGAYFTMVSSEPSNGAQETDIREEKNARLRLALINNTTQENFARPFP